MSLMLAPVAFAAGADVGLAFTHVRAPSPAPSFIAFASRRASIGRERVFTAKRFDTPEYSR